VKYLIGHPKTVSSQNIVDQLIAVPLKRMTENHDGLKGLALTCTRGHGILDAAKESFHSQFGSGNRQPHSTMGEIADTATMPI
jgi:hypothetical protein